MMRYFAGMVVMLGLVGPAAAGELDAEFPGATETSQAAVENGTAGFMGTAGALAALTPQGSELDQEEPTQAWGRRWGWGGWCGPRIAFSYNPCFNPCFNFGYASYPRFSFSLGVYRSFYPSWGFGYPGLGFGYAHVGLYRPWGCYW